MLRLTAAISRASRLAVSCRSTLPASALQRGSLARFTPTLQGMSPSRGLFVKIDTTPNPDSLKFIPEDRAVLPESMGSGLHFSDISEAKGSKLVRKLLKVKEINGVFLGRDFISVNKKEDVNWAPLKPIVLNAIMDAFAEQESKGTPIIEDAPPAPDTTINPDDDEITAMIKELLETRIRPAVQEDGGDIFLVGWDEPTGTVKVRMAGSCVGCPSSTATLHNGVENMLKHYIPEVQRVMQVQTELDEIGHKELNSLEERLKAAGADV